MLFLGKYRAKLAFALSRSLIIGWSFTRSVGMPMFSRLFALINDQNRFGLVFQVLVSNVVVNIVFVGFC